MFTLRPVDGREFVNREDIIEDMVSTLSNRNSLVGFTLYGQRRVGKTSVFKEVQRRLEDEKDIIPVYFSLWNLVENNVSEFVKQFSVAVLEAYRKKLSLRHNAKNLLDSSIAILRDVVRQTNVTLKVQDKIEFLLSFTKEEGKNYANLIEKAFDLPEKLSKQTNTKCILLIDEFPSIIDLKNGSKIGEGIIKKIRTLHEDQKNTVMCISGSIRKTMEITALSSTSAFYRQFVVKEIHPLSKKYVKEMMIRNIEKRITEGAIDKIYEFTNGIPFYVQFLGRELEKKDLIEEKDVNKAMDEFINEEGGLLFREEFSNLSSKERLIVTAMAKESISSPSEIAGKINENLNTVGMFLTYLEEKAIVRKKERGIYVFEDPVFEKWLLRR